MNLSRLLPLIRVLCMAAIAVLMPQQALAQFSGSGAGTANDPYLIFNPAQLNQMRNFLGDSKVYFQLMNDIDMSAWIAKNSPTTGWQAVGKSSNPFKGTLVGNGHTITGITHGTNGFFGYLEQATVTNLTLEDVNFTNYACGGFAYHITGGSYSGITVTGNIKGTGGTAGGFAAYESNSNISDINVSAAVTGGTNCGGILGSASPTAMSNCYFRGNSVTGTTNVGGLIGLLSYNYGTVTYTSCQATGCYVTGTENVGGAIGKLDMSYILSSGSDRKPKLTLSSWYTDAVVSGSNSIGGITGYCDLPVSGYTKNNIKYTYAPSLDLSDCGSNCKITADWSYVGGLIGNATLTCKYDGGSANYYGNASISVADCFAMGTISAAGGCVGGIIGKTIYVGTASGSTTQYGSVSIADSYFNGSISSSDSHVGGIVGSSDLATITRCYSCASLSGLAEVGGIVGNANIANRTSVKSSVSACPTINASNEHGNRIYGYGTCIEGASGTSWGNLALASTLVSVNGKIITSYQGDEAGDETLKMRATYQGKGWNFTNNWAIQETECFPYKTTQTAPPIITNKPETGSMAVLGKSVSGGDVFVTVGNSTVQTTCNDSNNWQVRIEEPLKAGQTISAYAVASPLFPSFSVITSVGYMGKGTEDDPYQVFTVSDLESINGDAYYILMNDLDLNEAGNWTPIGHNGGAMCHLDGDNHIITGLSINNPSLSYGGLFASLHNGSVKNLVIKEANLQGGDYIGILAGRLTNSTVTNCQVEGTVQGGNHTGGLCGYASGSTISGSHVTANVDGGDRVGGIAGSNEATSFTLLSYNGNVKGGSYAGGITSVLDAASTIDRCFTSGEVATTSTTAGDTYAGGIVGLNTASITDSYSTSAITSTQYGAGIAGLNQGSITRCYSSGNIKSVGFAAGIAGYNDGASASVSSCLSANEQISLSAEHPIGMRVVGGIRNGAVIPEFGSNYALEQMIISLNGVQEDIYDDPLHGVAITVSETKTKDAYTAMGWDFSKTWHIDGNGGMPYLAELGASEGGSILPDNYLTVETVETEAGKQIELLVDLHNKNVIAGVQFDIALPEGITIATDSRERPKITLGSRVNSSKHSIASRIGGNGLMRVLLMPRSAGATLTGNSGNVVKITLDIAPELVNGTYKVELKYIVLSDEDPTISIYPPVCPAKITVNNDHLSTHPCEGRVGGNAVLSVDMDNKSQIIGYQFDLILPEGVTIANNTFGKPAFAHGERASNLNHTFEARRIADNTTRVLCFSPNNSVIPANSGELFNVTLNIGDDCQLGEMPIHIRNVYLSNVNNASIAIDDMTSTLTVKRFVRKGDVNIDGIINLSDVTGLTNLAGGMVSDRLDSDAADINEDEKVTVADLPLELNLVFAEAASARASRRMLAAKATSQPDYRNMQIYVEPFHIMPGETKPVKIYLYNPEDEVFAFQFRTVLPEGLEFVPNEDGLMGIPCEERSEYDFTLDIQANRGGYGIVGYNGLDMWTFYGTEGAICEAFVKAADNAPAGVYKTPIFETELTDTYGSQFYTVDNDFTIIVGDVSQEESISINGYLTDISTDALNGAIASNSIITELDLSGVLESKSAKAITSANPNMLVIAPAHMALANKENVIIDGVCDKLTLTDVHPFGTSKAFTAVEASYSRRFAPDTFESLYLPFKADTPSDMVIGVLDSPLGRSASLDFKVGEHQAHMPCIALSANGGDMLFTATQTEVTPEPEQAFGNYIGVYRHGKATDQHYMLKGNTANLSLEKTDKLQPFRAYVLSNSGDLPIVTGVENVACDTDQAGEEIIYNLQGMRLYCPKENLPTGIYIINGIKTPVVSK